ncbi:MAG: hypothetical protein MZU91_14280 [Desulfosudis oleivorans]|nr:hypothetical protein [Desulfosudis oleivorans]
MYEGIVTEAKERLGKPPPAGARATLLWAALDDLDRGTWTITVLLPVRENWVCHADSYGVLEVLRSQGRFFGAFGSWVTGQLAFPRRMSSSQSGSPTGRWRRASTCWSTTRAPRPSKS